MVKVFYHKQIFYFLQSTVTMALVPPHAATYWQYYISLFLHHGWWTWTVIFTRYILIDLYSLCLQHPVKGTHVLMPLDNLCGDSVFLQFVDFALRHFATPFAQHSLSCLRYELVKTGRCYEATQRTSQTSQFRSRALKENLVRPHQKYFLIPLVRQTIIH